MVDVSICRGELMKKWGCKNKLDFLTMGFYASCFFYDWRKYKFFDVVLIKLKGISVLKKLPLFKWCQDGCCMYEFILINKIQKHIIWLVDILDSTVYFESDCEIISQKVSLICSTGESYPFLITTLEVTQNCYFLNTQIFSKIFWF